MYRLRNTIKKYKLDKNQINKIYEICKTEGEVYEVQEDIIKEISPAIHRYIRSLEELKSDNIKFYLRIVFDEVEIYSENPY